MRPILGYVLKTRLGSGPILKNTGVSDWLINSMLSYTEWPFRQGLNVTLGGFILRMGMKGSDEGPNECPTHRTAPDMGGSTSIDSMSSLTLLWIV